MSAVERVAMVTGGARGIGFAIAEKLCSDGYSVIISDILAEAANESASKLADGGARAISVEGDVSKPESVDAMFKASIEELGRVDVLVNNAGITRDNLILRLDAEDWDVVMDVNLKGAFLCTKAAARIMIKNRWGRIINISSIVGIMGNAGQSNYSASKAGLIGLTKSAAKELAGRSITVNAVAPGYIQTEMTEKLPDSARQAFLSMVPLKRPGTPADIAGIVSFLASDLAEYVTGQVIHCDGGMVM